MCRQPASSTRRALAGRASRLRRDQASSSYAIRAGSYAGFPLASKAMSNSAQISAIRIFDPPTAGRLPVTPAVAPEYRCHDRRRYTLEV